MNRAHSRQILLLVLIFWTVFFSPDGIFCQENNAPSPIVADLPGKIVLTPEQIDKTKFLFQTVLENNTDQVIENTKAHLDATDFVDNSILMHIGRINPGETKTLKVTSFFNDFIASWEGESQINIKMTISYVFKNDLYQEQHEIPLRYKAHQATSKTKVDTIVAKIEDSSDTLDIFDDPKKETNKQERINRPKMQRGYATIHSFPDHIDINVDQAEPEKGAILYGKTLSVLKKPISEVCVVHKYFDKKTYSSRCGNYQLPYTKGKIDLEFIHPAFWNLQIPLNIMEQKPMKMSGTRLIPKLDHSGMFVLKANGRYQKMEKVAGYGIKGTYMDAYLQIRSVKNAISIDNNMPSFFYIPNEKALPYQDGFTVRRIAQRDLGKVENITGPKMVELDGFVAVEDAIDTSIKGLQDKKAFQVKIQNRLKPGYYAISNILGKRKALNIASIQKPFIYLFRVREDNAPKITTDHTVTPPAVISTRYANSSEKEKTLYADLKLNNIGKTWYLIKLAPEGVEASGTDQLNMAKFPSNFRRTFILGPPADNKKTSYIAFNSLEFSQNTFLKFQVERNNKVTSFLVILDMMHRAIFAERLPMKYLQVSLVDDERLADQLPEKLREQSFALVDAIHNKKWEASKAVFLEIHHANFLKTAEKAFSNSGALRDFGKKYKMFFGNIDKIGEEFMETEEFQLMKELAKFSHDAPLSGECMVYVRE